MNIRTQRLFSKPYYDSLDQSTLIQNVFDSLRARQEPAIEVECNGKWIPFFKAFPRLEKGGDVLCAECARFYSIGECVTKTYLPKWGTVEQMVCPKGHIASSDVSYGELAQKRMDRLTKHPREERDSLYG